MNIAVIGMGGVGGYFGGKLSKLLKERDDINLYYIARGKHLDEIKKSGLTLETVDESLLCRPTLATDNFDDLPELDLCLITVKSYELENVASRLKPKITDSSVIIPLLNGADIYERIRGIITKGIVLPACVYIISFIEKPGKVVQKGASCVIHTGSESGRETAAESGVTGIFELFESCGIKYRWENDPRPVIWKKFLFIASFALVTANYDAVIGAVMESEKLSGEVKSIMNEIKNIAESKGVSLEPDVCETSYEIGNKFDYDSTTSFQRDYRIKDKPDERDIFGSAVIRMGKEQGVSTEVTERIFAEIDRNKPL